MEDGDGIIGAIGALFYVAFFVLYVIGLWKVFEKAGKPGWAAIIPIYNVIVLLEIVGKPVWWIVLFLIPIVNLVIAIILMHQLSLSFGKGTAFTVGLVLFGFIFVIILGFDSSTYLGPGGEGLATAGGGDELV